MKGIEAHIPSLSEIYTPGNVLSPNTGKRGLVPAFPFHCRLHYSRADPRLFHTEKLRVRVNDIAGAKLPSS